MAISPTNFSLSIAVAWLAHTRVAIHDIDKLKFVGLFARVLNSCFMYLPL
jgi:hypothetical protein